MCRADVIVYGVVREQARSEEFQRSTIAATRVLEGPEGADAFIERSSAHLHGGHPRYEPGQEVIVLLEAIPGTPDYRTLGMSQGKFLVEKGRVPRVDLTVPDFLAELERQSCDGEQP